MRRRQITRSCSIPVTVLRIPLSATALRLYGALSHHVDGDMTCWPSQKRLRSFLPPGTNEKTVRRGLKELVASELLVVEHRDAAVSGVRSPRQRSNFYRLFSPLEEWEVEGVETPHPRADTPPTLGGVETLPGTGTTSLRSSDTSLTEVSAKKVSNVYAEVVQAWIDGWIVLAREKGADPELRPSVAWGRACQNIKPHVDQLTVQEVLRRLVRFFRSRDSFILRRNHDFGAFITTINQFASEEVPVTPMGHNLAVAQVFLEHHDGKGIFADRTNPREEVRRVAGEDVRRLQPPDESDPATDVRRDPSGPRDRARDDDRVGIHAGAGTVAVPDVGGVDRRDRAPGPQGETGGGGKAPITLPQRAPDDG